MRTMETPWATWGLVTQSVPLLVRFIGDNVDAEVAATNGEQYHPGERVAVIRLEGGWWVAGRIASASAAMVGGKWEASQSIVTGAGLATIAPWDTEVEYSPAVAGVDLGMSALGVFTFPVAGVWLASFTTEYPVSALGSNITRIDCSHLSVVFDAHVDSSGAASGTVTSVAMFRADAGDTMVCQTLHNAAGNQTVTALLELRLLGPAAA